VDALEEFEKKTILVLPSRKNIAGFLIFSIFLSDMEQNLASSSSGRSPMWLHHKIEKKGKKGKNKNKKPIANDNRTYITKSTPVVNYAFRTWPPNLL
jgi:hypothetical protein